MNVHLDVNPNAWFGDDAYDQRNGRAPDVPLEASKCSRVHGAALRTSHSIRGCRLSDRFRLDEEYNYNTVHITGNSI